MKNRNIVHARQEVEIYKAYYRPSFNLWRIVKSFLGIFIFGSASAAQYHSYVPLKKKRTK